MSIRIFLCLLLIGALGINLKEILPVKQELGFIRRNLNLSYEKKMLKQIGPLYPYFVFLQANIPEDAVVVTPPRGEPWMNLASNTYMSYFLWPRKVIEIYKPENPIPEEATYALLAWYSKDSSPSSELDWPLKFDKSKVKIYQEKDPKLGVIKLK